MSGNPFRQRVQLAGSDALAAPSTPPPISTSVERKVKKVRIRTPPPLSPDSIHETTPLYRPISQTYEDTYFPPPATFDSNSKPLPPAPRERPVRNYEDEARSIFDLDNTRESSVSTVASSSGASAIANPFARTLETIENAHGRRTKQNPIPHSAMKGRNNPTEDKTPKQTLDVDSFKRLLLTGKASSTVSTAPTAATSGAISSNTYTASSSDSNDTLSQFRQPLDKPTAQLITNAQRTSFEAQPQLDDESISTMPADNDMRKKTPPPPPKHRHGKLMGQRTPQVVSFADFTPTDVLLSTARRPSKELPPVPLEKTNSNQSISLAQPPPPPRRQSQESVTEEQLSSDEEVPQSSTVPSTLSFPVKPVSSSLATSSLFQTRPPQPPRSRADSSQSISSQPEMFMSNPTEPVNTSKIRPPPPPTRRPGGKPFSNASSTPTNSATSPDLFPQPDELTLVPEPRRGSLPVAPSSRSSSISGSNRTLVPPPPPPRRRRGSSKSSVDFNVSPNPFPSQVDSSRGSFDKLRVSHAGLEDVTEAQLGDSAPAPSRGIRGSQDVLSDLDKLQAEVDALRSSYG